MTTRRKLLIAAAGAAVAGGGLTWWLTRPDDPAPEEFLAPAWSVALPDFGGAVATRVTSGVALVVQQRGVTAFDRVGGGELWRRDTGDEATAAFGLDGLGADDAARYVRATDDAVVIARYGGDGVGARGYEVVDLATGTSRFTAGLDGAAGLEVVVTKTSLVVHRWWDTSSRRRLSAYALADGAELWTRDSNRYTILPADTSVRDQAVDVPNAGPLVLAPAGDFALLTGSPDDVGGGSTRITVVGLADGADAASWDVVDDGNVDLRVVGGYVVDVGVRGVLKGHDRATGTLLWTREANGAFDQGDFCSLIGEQLIDPVARQLVGLASGQHTPHPDMGGRRLAAVGGLYLGLDEGRASIAGIDGGGRVRWEAGLGTGSEARVDAVVVAGERVVMGGVLGGEPRLWVVELGMARVRVVEGGVLSGFESGAVVSYVEGSPRTVRLYEVWE